MLRLMVSGDLVIRRIQTLRCQKLLLAIRLQLYGRPLYRQIVLVFRTVSSRHQTRTCKQGFRWSAHTNSHGAGKGFDVSPFRGIQPTMGTPGHNGSRPTTSIALFDRCQYAGSNARAIRSNGYTGAIISFGTLQPASRAELERHAAGDRNWQIAAQTLSKARSRTGRDQPSSENSDMSSILAAWMRRPEKLQEQRAAATKPSIKPRLEKFWNPRRRNCGPPSREVRHARA